MIIDETKFMNLVCKSIHDSTGTNPPCLNQSTSCLAEPILRVCDISRLLDKAEVKEEEPIKVPSAFCELNSYAWACPKCKFFIGYYWHFCPSCGQKLKMKVEENNDGSNY